MFFRMTDFVYLLYNLLIFNLKSFIYKNFLLQANLPKEISDYMTKMGARIPNIKPGKATIDYLTKVQASTRFWGNNLRQDLNICFLLPCSIYCFPF